MWTCCLNAVPRRTRKKILEMITEYTHTYKLTAAQCNAQREAAPATLVQQIIDVATEHADILNIGFKRMGEDSNLWVLSRLAYDIKRYPSILEEYTITTWIEGYNKLFSDRNFMIRSVDTGELLGYARTVWMAIDKTTRRPSDLTSVADPAVMRPDIECAMERPGKIRLPKEHPLQHEYRFGASDIDFNRHVTSRRYVELAIDQLPLDVYDQCLLSRFEIAFSHESLCADTVKVVSGSGSGDSVVSAIVGPQGEERCISRALFVSRADGVLVPASALL